MSEKEQQRPITGAAVRAYRQRLGMTQAQFADAVRVTQGLVSQWESGRTAIGDESQRGLWKRFDHGHQQSRLGRFLEEFNRVSDPTEKASDQSTFAMTLMVRKWKDEFDLAGGAAQEPAAGMVTVHLPANVSIVAIELPAGTRKARGEIVVFARESERAPSNPGRWLIKQRRGNGAPQWLILEKKQGGSSPPRMKVLFPKGAVFRPESTAAAFRAVYEGRYL